MSSASGSEAVVSMRVRFDGFILDTDRKELSRGGVPVRLAPRAFSLLSYLVAQRPRAVSKRDLVDHIWSGNVVEEANLKALVLDIRKALEERGGRPEVIRTVYGHGYAFACPAVEEEAIGSTPRVRVEVQQRVILLPEGIHEIGRDPGCAVFIDASSVSRFMPGCTSAARLFCSRTTAARTERSSPARVSPMRSHCRQPRACAAATPIC